MNNCDLRVLFLPSGPYLLGHQSHRLLLAPTKGAPISTCLNLLIIRNR